MIGIIQKNATRSKEPRIISTPDSSVIIAVIPTNEELAIARKSAAIAEAGTDTYGHDSAVLPMLCACVQPVGL